MKVLVIGGGGREHAMARKLAESRNVDKVYCAPGNAGISDCAECIDVNPNDFPKLLDFVKYEWIDLTVVGPEEPLSKGISDAFVKEGRRIMGPVASGAMLESSKQFSKDFMKRFGIPTAEYKVFMDFKQASDYVRLKGAPIVVKADGLAAGKGVFVCDTVEDALDALKSIIKDRAFGNAGDKVVVEQCLKGEEASFMAFVDGKTIAPMVSCQDHKRIFNADKGPNTGGMGAYSPAPVVTPELEKKIMKRIMEPTLSGLRHEGIDYRGVLYAGIMIEDGEPYVLEFNCRMGDPETQPVLSRLDTDFAEICMAVAEGRLAELNIKWKDEAAVCVVMASGGYPGAYEKGKAIKGLDELKDMPGVNAFHAGTAFSGNDIVTAGGRVLGITATGADIKSATARAYEAVRKVSFEGAQYRTDIAQRALRRA